jgi:Tfp pilus assembly protein PilE
MLTKGKITMKKNESGRSMVEMLGVLAIIGVLSIGGIAGYTLAMNRYRANEVLDTAAKLAIVSMSNASKSAALSDIGLDGDNVAGTTFTAEDGVVTITGTSDAVKALIADMSTKYDNSTGTFNFN